MNKKIRTPFATIALIILTVLQIFEFTDICSELFDYSIHFNIFTAINLVIGLVLCVILITKQYNNILVIVLGCQTLIDVVFLIRFFSISNFLALAAHALLTVFALAVCEQTFLKTDLSKIKKLADKLFYLPAILYLACEVYCLIVEIIYPYPWGLLWLSHIIAFLNVFVLLNLGMWLKDPYYKSESFNAAGENNDSKINVLCTTQIVNKLHQGEYQTADALKKYKELFDSGVITQEEYDTMKKQLLEL